MEPSRGADGGVVESAAPRLASPGFRGAGDCRKPDSVFRGPQNERNAPMLKVCALFSLPFCASAVMSVNSASRVRFSVVLWYTPNVYLLFFATRVGFTSPLARSRLLSP